MKYGIALLAMIVAVIVTGYCTTVAVENAYEEYVRTSEELLWMLEETCELNGTPWGDTVCETDIWKEYCDSREVLGLGYLEHYSKR